MGAYVNFEMLCTPVTWTWEEWRPSLWNDANMLLIYFALRVYSDYRVHFALRVLRVIEYWQTEYSEYLEYEQYWSPKYCEYKEYSQYRTPKYSEYGSICSTESRNTPSTSSIPEYRTPKYSEYTKYLKYFISNTPYFTPRYSEHLWRIACFCLKGRI